MENKEHLLIAANYQLFAQRAGEKELIEKTAPDRPYVFITGFQMAIDGFEEHVSGLAAGDTFRFTLAPSEGFGEYDPEGVHVLPRDSFNVKGRFDSENVFQGAIIAVQDPQGQEFHAQVIKVDKEHVTIDTNHPLAGKLLTFEGDIVENRPATQAEVDQLIKQLMSEEEEEGHCCGHCHHEDGKQCQHHEDDSSHHCRRGEGGKGHHCCHHH